MDQKDLDFEQDLIDSELLLKNTARSMDDDAEYSLESILAEFGEDASPAAPVERKAGPERDAAPDGGKKEKPPVVIPFPGAKMPEEAEAPEAADLPKPEAADGGLIGLVQDGDTIHIDIPGRKLELVVPEAEIEERRKHFVPVEKDVKSPFLRRYAKLVTSASTGGAYRKI